MSKQYIFVSVLRRFNKHLFVIIVEILDNSYTC